MRGTRLHLLVVTLFMLLMFLQYRLWFESDGVNDMLQLKKMLVTQIAENEQLKKYNETLLFQVKRMQHSQDAIESRARNELGMVKRGETFYQIVK